MSKKSIVVCSLAVLMFASSLSVKAQDLVANSDFNTPPSCVITAPHVNAYFRTGNAVIINAYSTDIGGAGPDGEVALVEFFIDGQKIGESTSSANKTFSISWNADELGEFIIKAVATDTSGKSFTSAGVPFTVGSDNVQARGLSSGKGKYLGNVVTNESVDPTFLDYWNAATSENGGKWQSVERNRDVMNWATGDMAYNLAKNNNLPYRYHTFAWGSQYPAWITTLEPAEFQEEMEEFIAAAAARYPYVDQIDVINEALPGHQEDTHYFIDGLGGTGESGYDWAVWMFKKAREYFPNAKLVLNDYGIVNSSNNINNALLMLEVLRDSGLVDGFGAQAHHFSLDNTGASTLKSNLDLMAEAGVPIYITEMDMRGTSGDEASQLSSYRSHFPVLWEHPDVAGITLWGYVYNAMWVSDAGLVYSSGEERGAMEWLREYMQQQPTVGYPFLDTVIAVEGLLMDPLDSETLFIGDTVQLSASLIPETATPQPVYWASDNLDVIGINQYGRIIANQEGSAVISATCSGKSVERTLFVVDTVIQTYFMFEAEFYESNNGGWLDNSTDVGGGQILGYLEDGNWATYELDVDSAGIYDFVARAASRTAGGTIEISIQDSVLNTLEIEDDWTNDWDDWYTTDPVEIELDEGTFELKLTFKGSSPYLFHLNWFEITFNRPAGSTQFTGAIETDLDFRVYPNPFTDQLHATYYLASASSVHMEILDLSGRVICSLVSETHQLPGMHAVRWDGAGVESGIYFLRCIIDGEVITKKTLLNK